MQLSFLKTILVVALGMNNAAAQSFTATKRFKCCTQEDCTDCIGGGIADSCYDADCYNVPGEVGRKSPVNQESGLEYKFCCEAS